MSRRAETIAISHFAVALLAGTMLAGIPAAALAQNTAAPAAAQPTPAAPPAATPAPAPAPAPVENTVIRTISVVGAQRLEANTILSYIQLRPGQVYTAVAADQALKDLAATELFSDTRIENNNGDVVITVAENPVINRIILEGNKRIKDDKITQGDQARPARDLHALEGPRRRLPHHRAVQAPGPLRRHRRAEDGAAVAEPRRYRIRDQRGTEVEGPRDQHHRQRGFLGREAQGRDDDQGGGPYQDPQRRHQLRSRQDGLRSAEAAPVLPDARLCRFPGGVRGRRADAGQEGLHHHLRGRGRKALQVRRREGGEPDSRLRQQGDDHAGYR